MDSAQGDNFVLSDSALMEKSNDSLQFAVLTGCLRISRESIFTGLNNLRVLSVGDGNSDILVEKIL